LRISLLKSDVLQSLLSHSSQSNGKRRKKVNEVYDSNDIKWRAANSLPFIFKLLVFDVVDVNVHVVVIVGGREGDVVAVCGGV